jgi:predicted transcriptional regulator
MQSELFRRRKGMGKTVALHVGDSLETVGARFTDAWKRAETGELHAGNAEVHLGFASWEAMVRVLSPKRLELLRHLHRHPSPNVRQLAAALGRDYRRVHEDVAALHEAGLLEKGEDGLRADYDAFDVRMKVAL